MCRVDQAHAWVLSQHGRLRRVAAEAGVSYWWLVKFSQNLIRDPGSRKIEALLTLRDRWDAHPPEGRAAA